MALHILRHKRWHVWNQDNEDRYAKDEREHKDEIEKMALSSRENALESRLELLKAKAGVIDPKNDQPLSQTGVTAGKTSGNASSSSRKGDREGRSSFGGFTIDDDSSVSGSRPSSDRNPETTVSCWCLQRTTGRRVSNVAKPIIR